MGVAVTPVLLLLLWPISGVVGHVQYCRTQSLWGPEDKRTRGYMMEDGTWILMSFAAMIGGPFMLMMCLARKGGWNNEPEPPK